MSITQEQIIKISKNLAKLHPKNEKNLEESINSILKYVDLLNEIDTENIEPTISVTNKKNNSLREDKEKKAFDTEELLKCSKQKIIANQIAINDIMK